MELRKPRYLEVQTFLGGIFGTLVRVLSDEWWLLALGILAGAALGFYTAREMLRNLGLPVSATYQDWAEELRKNRAKRP